MMPDADIGSPAAEDRKGKWGSAHGLDLLIVIPILWGLELALGIILVLSLGASFSPKEHPVPILFTALISAVLTFVITWLFVCKKYGKSFTNGFFISRPTKKTYAISLSIGIIYGLIAATLMSRFSTELSFMSQMATTPTGLLCIIILAMLLPPVEEMYYRGFIFPVLFHKWGPIPAVLVVIVWFAAAHSFQLAQDWIGIPVVAVAGAIWTMQRLVTGSLTQSLITHWTYNLCLVVVSLVEVFHAS